VHDEVRRINHRVPIDFRRRALDVIEQHRSRPVAADVKRSEPSVGRPRHVEIAPVSIVVGLPDVTGDPDDRSPRPWRRAALRARDVAHASAKRAARWPEPSGQRLTDHGTWSVSRRRKLSAAHPPMSGLISAQLFPDWAGCPGPSWFTGRRLKSPSVRQRSFQNARYPAACWVNPPFL
jgi:hypothetical protein